VPCLHRFGGKHAGHDRRRSAGSTTPIIPPRCALRRPQPPDPRFLARGRCMTASRAIQKRVFGSARKNEGRISHIPGNGNVGNTATHPPKPPRNHTSDSDLGTLAFSRKNIDKPSARPVSARAAAPPKQGRKRFPHRVAIHLRQPRNKPPSIEGAATTGAVRKERRQAPASALRAYRRWSPILSERRASVVE
jgi:hypothetical protein